MNRDIKFKIPNDKKEYNYIGIDFQNNDSQFIFPPKYLKKGELTEKDKQKEAKKIILLLKKIRQEYLLNGNNSELFQFNSMIWLIQDYIEHGYYVETEHLSSFSSNGKIDWKKTIKNNSIFFANGEIIYNEFVRDRIIIDDSQILTQIYKACLNFSVAKLGFLFGIGQTENSVYNIDRDNAFLIFYLENELNKTFKDYKKQLLNHLILIITAQNSKQKNNSFSIYDTEFEYVFEALINKIFGTENVKEFYNSYSYYIQEQNPSASKLRPDTIMKDDKNKTYYILDAKYYNYGYSKNFSDLPQSSAISKQVAYNHYLRENLKEDEKGVYNIKSVFIFPFSKENGDDYLKYIGYAKRDNNPNKDDQVQIVLVDLKVLIDKFLLNDTDTLKKDLLDLLIHIK